MAGQPFIGSARFAGDRYERLRQAAATAAGDPAVADAPPPFDAAGLDACVRRVIAERVLDPLTDRESDWVSMALMLDFCDGPGALALRLQNLLAQPRDPRVAVAAGALASVLRIVIDTVAVTLPNRGWAAEDR